MVTLLDICFQFEFNQIIPRRDPKKKHLNWQKSQPDCFKWIRLQAAHALTGHNFFWRFEVPNTKVAQVRNQDFNKNALPLGITSDYLDKVKPYGMFRTFVRSLQASNKQAVAKNVDFKYTPGNVQPEQIFSWDTPSMGDKGWPNMGWIWELVEFVKNLRDRYDGRLV